MCKCNVLVHLTAVTCCRNHVFVLFFFLSIQIWAEIAASERGVRKGPGIGYFSPQFSPGPTWVEDISHFSQGHWDLGGVSFSLMWDWRDEGAPGRKQLHGGWLEQLLSHQHWGFQKNSKAWRVFFQPCAQLVCNCSHSVSTQLYSVLLHGPQIAYLLSFWLKFLNKPIGNDK